MPYTGRVGRKEFQNRPFAQVERALREQFERQAAPAPEPKPPPPRLPPEAEAPDDELLFAREMLDVRPLPRDNRVPAAERNVDAARRDSEAEAMAELADLVAGRAEFDFTGSDEFIEGIAHGLDRRLLKRLRQGQFAVQGHLDLHGLTRQEARADAEQFIARSRARGHRCVRIVHGRGLNSKDQLPVLKESLRVWLARGRIARSVLAFCSARPSDGGGGAVYVLLRR